MFSVIISEKGGAERRESFDRTEINVGRVQGNDLMLPKGNVSKRHARLLYRDGRFIVTDLKSTNGTYVNGRKITQATIVREGDKIYIGDFVLRVDTGNSSINLAGGSSDDQSLPPDAPPSDAGAQLGSLGGPTAAQPTSALIGEASRGVSFAPSTSSIPGAATLPPQNLSDIPGAPERVPSARPSGTRIESKGQEHGRQEFVSHFPLEQDPDESLPLNVPVAPRIPQPPRPPARPVIPPLPPRPPTSTLEQVAARQGSSPQLPPPASPASPTSPTSIERTPLPAPAPSQGAPRRTTPSMSGEEQDRVLAHRNALASLIERVSQMVDRSTLESGSLPSPELIAEVERALGSRSRGELPPEFDLDSLLAEARRELVEYGPLTPLLDDEDVTEIQVVRHDYVVAMHGRRPVPLELGFSSELGVARILRRLCAAAGRPLASGEVFVERRLPSGVRLFAVLPPASDHGHMFVIRKPQRASMSLEDLVRSGTISRAMAGLFSQCVAARANILITGAAHAGTTSLLGALASAGSADERLVVLQEDDELILHQPHAFSIMLGDSIEQRARAVQAAARLRPERLVVGAFSGQVAAAVVEAMGEGAEGVLAASRAATARQAVARLAADLAAARSGLLPDTTREWLASAFDLVIEIVRLRDGRHRVLRVAELVAENGRLLLRDIFTFAVERTAAGGAVEGSFHPTGVVPAIAHDLIARGIVIDASIFTRHLPSRPDAGPQAR